MTEPYTIDVKPDGTWLQLNGTTKAATIRLESLVSGPICRGAIAEIRTVLQCEVCHGDGFWVDKEGIDIPCDHDF